MTFLACQEIPIESGKYDILSGTAQVLPTPTPPLTTRPAVTRRGLMPKCTSTSVGPRGAQRVTLVCEHCGKTFCRYRSELRCGRGRFCSASCRVQENKRVPFFDPERDCWVVPLTRGKEALIDEEDAVRVATRVWCAFPHRQTWRAQTTIDHRRIELHRFILGEEAPPLIDHKNGDGLDCRRRNLRPATPHQNLANRGAQINNTSGYKGVTRSPTPGKWIAQITVHGKNHYLGTHGSAVEAAAAYDRAAIASFGEFARLNFPIETDTEDAA